jgi:hypothetical protein
MQGRVSKYVTSGSKTVVKDVIGSLCVSLGSSTVQPHRYLSDLNFFNSPERETRLWNTVYPYVYKCGPH